MRPIPLTLLCAILAALPALAQKAGEVPRVEPGPAAKKGEVLEWTSAEGQPYWYRVPDSISAKRPANLLIMLHGTGLPWGWAFWNYPIATGRWRPDDVVVAPEGLTPGQGGTFNFVQGRKDGEQIAGLIRTFRDKLPIDRVYLYGHSQGAFFCYWFAGEHPELVDGIVAHAGNVLDVRHTDLAREKIGIGILHGRADAVVLVECAFRTERIYKEEGYKKVKLYVVDGLTEQSGHWPLPDQVGEMLEWLDRVTVRSPVLALRAALEEVRAERPDLHAIVSGAADADAMLRTAKKEDKEAATGLRELVGAFLARAREQHVEALAGLDLRAKEPPADATHARLAHRVFAADDDWRKAMRSLASTARSHDKRIAKALRDFGNKPDGRNAVRAAAALAAGWLGDGWDALHQQLARSLDGGVDDLDRERRGEIATRLDAYAEAVESGKAAFDEVTKRAASAFLADRGSEVEALLEETRPR